MSTSKVVTIFGSSKPHQGEPDYLLARELGRLIASAGYTICNGGYGGTMEAAARGAKEAGGLTIGVTMEFIRPQANQWTDKIIVVKTLVDRLMKLIELGDAYVALRGGTGTLLELAAVWELMNKRVIKSRPVVVVGEFWTSTVETVKRELTLEGLEWSTKHVTVAKTPEECVRVLKDLLR
ncbi:MAG: LOG family protein [Bacteroidota bacterium]